MNTTQQTALNWLISKGNKKEDITFRPYKSPNFLTKSGKAYEIKRLYGNKIIFYDAQYQQLKDFPNTIILVFKDGITSPFLEFKFSEIKSRPPNYKGTEINWVYKDQKVNTIRISPQTKERLQKHGKMGEDFDTLINRLLNKIEKNE